MYSKKKNLTYGPRKLMSTLILTYADLMENALTFVIGIDSRSGAPV